MRARHLIGRGFDVIERQRIERSLKPSARDLFPALRERLLTSRPVVGERKTVVGRDRIGRARYRREPILGAPTFRNVIDENGQHL